MKSTKMKHTAGPWRISQFELKAGGVSRTVIGSDDYAVARIWRDGRTEAEHEADAALISAAPDLLDALKTLCEYYGICVAPIPVSADAKVWSMAWESIAKAEGRP